MFIWNSRVYTKRKLLKHSCNWLMQSVLGLSLQKAEKLSSQETIPKIFERSFKDFFWKILKNYDRNRAMLIKVCSF